MPLYEYKCDRCGGVFEVIEKFSDAPLTKHANCGGDVHRLLSAPALQFKGSGWYITDYAKGKSGENGSQQKSDSQPASSESGKTAATDTSTPASTETKPSSSPTKSDAK
jgi:putative FmdB family regulatory protein